MIVLTDNYLNQEKTGPLKVLMNSFTKMRSFLNKCFICDKKVEDILVEDPLPIYNFKCKGTNFDRKEANSHSIGQGLTNPTS